MSNVCPHTPADNLSKLTSITQLANNNLRASGGSFSIPKCSFRNLLLNPKGVLHDVSGTFNVQSTPTTEHQQLHQMMRSEPHHTLGVHLTPDRRPTTQYNILIRQSKALGARIANNPLNSQHLYTAITQYIQSSITFALVPQRLTTLQIHQLQSAVRVPTLHRLHASSKVSRDVLYARITWKAGIPNWGICNLARQLQVLQMSFDTEALLGFSLRAYMRALQLEYGHGVNFMESMDINMQGMTLFCSTLMHPTWRNPTLKLSIIPIQLSIHHH